MNKEDDVCDPINAVRTWTAQAIVDANQRVVAENKELKKSLEFAENLIRELRTYLEKALTASQQPPKLSKSLDEGAGTENS